MTTMTAPSPAPSPASASTGAPIGLDEAQRYCTDLTKRSGSNFYYSFFFLSPDRRSAMYTVYAFCKEVDNAVDEPPPGSNPQAELARWRAELTAAYHGTPTHPVTISLADHARRFGIPQTLCEELIAGVEMDLTITRYQTFDDLYRYCYRVASVVGLICLRIFGTHSPTAEHYAIDLGLAFQLTNILRDLAVDGDNGRIYLPLEDLARFHYTEADLLARRKTPAFDAMMAFQCQRARRYYAQARSALQSLPPADRRALTVAEIMRGVYSRILDRIEGSQYQVFGPRIRLSSAHRLGLAAAIWLRARRAT
ncbi:MAG: presqualene diphosphate synthase HpnD [Nitrospiraceae bacterium]